MIMLGGGGKFAAPPAEKKGGTGGGGEVGVPPGDAPDKAGSPNKR